MSAAIATKAGEKAIDLIIDELKKMRDFVFVVNNRTEYNLRRTDTAGDSGSWPLQDVKAGECVAAGFDRNTMSVAVEYTVVGHPSKKKIILGGSWPVIGGRKIVIDEDKDVEEVWDGMEETSDDSSGPDGANRAMIREKNGGYIYEFDITAL